MSSRLLPKCAYCGGSLAYRDKITLNFRGLTGSPVVGWHMGCHTKDALVPVHEADRDALRTLRVLLARGRERIVSYRRTSCGYGDGYGVHGRTLDAIRTPQASASVAEQAEEGGSDE